MQVRYRLIVPILIKVMIAVLQISYIAYLISVTMEVN